MDGVLTTEVAGARRPNVRGLGLAVLALAPLLLLGAVIGLIAWTGAGLRPSGAPPVEDLAIQRISLPRPGLIELEVFNAGASDTVVAQVLVNEAYWDFEIEPGPRLARFGRAIIRVPYPWVETEPHEVRIITSTGLTFGRSVDVALRSPSRDWRALLTFGLLGLYVGVVPVALGLMWHPLLRHLGQRGVTFMLSLTVGLLVFLLIDTLLEAVKGVPLVIIVAVLSSLAIESVGGSRPTPLGLAYLIALGIGLHNLGEGLAIGAAYTLGNVAFATFLVIGFAVHNITEGLGIAAPLARERPGLLHFGQLTLLAGGPAIVGTWLGVFVYSDLAAAVFLATGAGAIAQVMWAVGRLVWAREGMEGRRLSWPIVAGLVAGVVVMYATALMIAG
jgi:zinc transporter ZupT